MRQLLRQPGFLRLAGAFAVNELSWWAGTLALSLLVYRRTGSAFGTAGFFVCAQVAPAFLSPALVGRLDRFSPRRTLPGLYALEALLYAVLAWLTWRFVLGPVLALALLDGVVALTARSLANASRTAILKPAGLVPEGSAATSTVFSVAYLVGPAVSGVIVAAGGTRAALLVSCALFLVMAIGLISRSVPERIVLEGPRKRRVRAAIAQARRDRGLIALLCTEAAIFAVFTIPVPVEVIFAAHTLHAGASGYGGLLSAWGGGAVVGALAYSHWRRASVRALLPLGSVMMGIGCAVMTFAPDIAVGLVGAAFAGIANGFVEVSISTEVQNRTEQSWMALTSSLSQSIAAISPGLGMILGAVIASLFSVRITLAATAAGAFLIAAAASTLFTAERLRPPLPPDEVAEAEPERRREPHAGTLV